MESKPKCEPKPTTACQCRKAYKFEFEFNPFMTAAVIIQITISKSMVSKWTGFYMITASVMKGLKKHSGM